MLTKISLLIWGYQKMDPPASMYTYWCYLYKGYCICKMSSICIYHGLISAITIYKARLMMFWVLSNSAHEENGASHVNWRWQDTNVFFSE